MKIKEKSSLACVIVKSNKVVPKVRPLKKGEKEERERRKRGRRKATETTTR